MQQNNYTEAEEAYRRALLLAPDNNKMCNLGICLMKQGRIAEAKETLRRVKPAVADGPRGVDSHLKAYERAQQMLRDLESEMMNRGGDRVEQSKLFDAFLGSSAIWQPQPCKEHNSSVNSNHNTINVSSFKHEDDVFGDENANSNVVRKHGGGGGGSLLVNSLNIDAPPFFSSSFGKKPSFPESLKRTRSGNAPCMVPLPESKVRKSVEKRDWDDLLPDSKDFEDAIIAAVIGCGVETTRNKEEEEEEKKVDKRLRVFQDITPSLMSSPRA